MKKPFSLDKIKQYGKWFFGQGKYYLLSLAVVFVTILYVSDILSFYPNLVSAGMTILGLLIILRLLMLDARKFTDQRPNTLRNWIKSFPITKPLEISVSGSISVYSSGKARVTGTLSENATIENKVEFLISQVDTIYDSIANVEERVNNVESSLTKEIRKLANDLSNLDKSLKTVIANHAVGTYDLNFFGIIMTLCGTVIQFFVA